jgi:siroheme synthase
VASAVSIVSGHAESAFGPVVDSLSPGCGDARRADGAQPARRDRRAADARGWSGSTPAAIVSAAGQRGAAAVDRHDWRAGAAVVDTRLPGTIVIGNVVALSSRIGGVIETAPQVAAPVARLSGEGQRG